MIQLTETERRALLGLVIEYVTASAKPGSELPLEFTILGSSAPATLGVTTLLQILVDANNRPPSIACPRCGAVSYNPLDVERRYCGACHQFHSMIAIEENFALQRWVYGVVHGEPEPPGDFLKAFAESIVRADPDNFADLRPALKTISARFPKYQCTCDQREEAKR
jgi:hypothetical protein